VSFWDKLMGRGKKAADDVADDPSHHGEGSHQESAEESAPAASEHDQDSMSGSGYPASPNTEGQDK
jgi:hypothetical protein